MERAENLRFGPLSFPHRCRGEITLRLCICMLPATEAPDLHLLAAAVGTLSSSSPMELTLALRKNCYYTINSWTFKPVGFL